MPLIHTIANEVGVRIISKTVSEKRNRTPRGVGVVTAPCPLTYEIKIENETRGTVSEKNMLKPGALQVKGKPLILNSQSISFICSIFYIFQMLEYSALTSGPLHKGTERSNLVLKTIKGEVRKDVGILSHFGVRIRALNSLDTAWKRKNLHEIYFDNTDSCVYA